MPRSGGSETAPVASSAGNPWADKGACCSQSDGARSRLTDLRHENSKRPTTQRDEVAREVPELMGGDFDGAQTVLDDLGPDSLS